MHHAHRVNLAQAVRQIANDPRGTLGIEGERRGPDRILDSIVQGRALDSAVHVLQCQPGQTNGPAQIGVLDHAHVQQSDYRLRRG